ncbi:YgfZ/GcvT domain-containing protein [Crenobacter cavernae]|uniref:Folate-binding protein n=1 Tax=Crenobacter cavernae TaxID=2290923 RepID=A0ABY0FGB0_9NEIS|nr:folate-binding protein YgfZ [Crenobacter cavernae]RXZ44171.1 folate-binding protein [Crenobacter cavernae]
MMEEWQQWVTQNDGHQDEGGRLVFAGHQEELKAVQGGRRVFAPLTQFALLRARGEDTLNFLQGQLSSDLRELDGSRSQYSSYSNAKGRMQANFLAWKDGDDYFLMLSSDIADVILKRLSLFVMRAKVKIERVDGQYLLAGFAGNGAAGRLAELGYAVPQSVHAVAGNEQGLVVALPAGTYLVVLPAESAAAAATSLAEGATRVGVEAWGAFDIAAGIAWITLPTQEQFVAQMTNMELIGAVSFKKGCFPGQEIVARTQYLGKLKRRLFRASISAAASPGDVLYSPSVPDQTIGMVVNVVSVAAGQMELLVVVQVAAWEAGVHLKSLDGPQLSPLSLPYPLPDRI